MMALDTCVMPQWMWKLVVAVGARQYWVASAFGESN